MIKRGCFKLKSCAKSIDFSKVTINSADGEFERDGSANDHQIDCEQMAASPILTPPAKRFHCDLSPIAVSSNTCTSSNNLHASQPGDNSLNVLKSYSTQKHGEPISNMAQVKVIMLI